MQDIIRTRALYIAKHRGLYYIIFDNTFSWTKKKTVKYQTYTQKPESYEADIVEHNSNENVEDVHNEDDHNDDVHNEDVHNEEVNENNDVDNG